MMAGAQHDNDQLPIFSLRQLGGELKGGQVLDYGQSSERQLCRLFLSIMEETYLPLNEFGDSRLKIDEISFRNCKTTKPEPHQKNNRLLHPNVDQIVRM